MDETCVPIPLRNRYGVVQTYTLVDEADEVWARRYSWYLSSAGYAVRAPGDGEQPVLMHRELLGLLKFDHTQVDHVNGSRLDNRRANLRTLTKKANLQNKHSGTPGKQLSTSQYRGVHFNSNRNKWVARPAHEGKLHFLGSFETEEQAALAVQEWRRTHSLHVFEGLSEVQDVGTMRAVFCSGFVTLGKRVKEPCRKFLGLVTTPYDLITCPRCNYVNRSTNIELTGN